MSEISLDSSIIISLLAEDIHVDNTIKALQKLKEKACQVYMSLVAYSEIWTGIELIGDTDRKSASMTSLNKILVSAGIKIVSDNLAIARRTAKAQADYKTRGGKRQILIPDFLIGANAAFYSSRILTTNQRDFLNYFQ